MVTLTKTLAAVGLVITLSAPSMADTHHHIDQLALTISRQSQRIVAETRHYRHAPEYRHLVADAREMCQLANHLHEVAHHHGDLAHLASDVQRLDARFHHLESIFDRVEQRAAHGHGHVHGNTSHVRELLNSIEDNIHHLQEDLESLRRAVHGVQPFDAPRRAVRATPYSSRWGGYHTPRQYHGYGSGGRHEAHNTYGQRSVGRGITIGGGSSRFTFRF